MSQERIDAFLASLPALRAAVSDLSAEQLRARPIPGKWSTLEVVAHLVDSDQAWCHRLKRVIAEDRPLLIGYDETRFTAGLYYHQANLEHELNLIEGMRHQMARILSHLPEEAWSRTGVHTEHGLLTLSRMLEYETDHVPHHIQTILDKRRALGLPDPT